MIAEREEYVSLSNPLNKYAITEDDPTAKHFYIYIMLGVWYADFSVAGRYEGVGL